MSEVAVPSRRAVAVHDPSVIQIERSDKVQSVTHALLQRALRITGATLGNVQLANWSADGSLRIAAQEGFRDEFLNFFERVQMDDHCACARALRRSEVVLVPDIALDPEFGPCADIVARAGVRAVQSTPLISSSGALIGIVSTHFPRHHRPTDLQLREIRHEAQVAANAIIALQARATTWQHQMGNSLNAMQGSRQALLRAEDVLKRQW
jgi:GAF domain-containing protein